LQYGHWLCIYGSFHRPLAAELVFLPETVVGLATQGNNSISSVLFFEEPGCPLVVGSMFGKKTITLDLPLQIGCFVYQYAKLRMLQFYYDFMDVFVDHRDFPLAAELVFLPETVVGLATQSNNSISSLLFFEEPGCHHGETSRSSLIYISVVREPTRSPKTSTWMFCCRRNPDPVPTEVSVLLTIKCIRIYKRELDFLT
jgi:hypothetical protein